MGIREQINEDKRKVMLTEQQYLKILKVNL